MLSVSEVGKSWELKKKDSNQVKQEQLRINYQLVEPKLENNESGLNRAYDILFEEVMKNREKVIHNG